MNIGLLFGSFDPFHFGHLAIARWALSERFDEVWIVLSPQNPTKASGAAPYEFRKAMVELSTQGEPKIKLCTVESELTAPFYTINTIEKLKSDFPTYSFSILCGTDVKESCHTWYRAAELLEMVEFVEYPRHGEGDLPFINVSSTEVRCGEKLDMIDPKVAQYIRENKVYCAHLERGKKHYAAGNIGGAINAWNKCVDEPHATTARALQELAADILDYTYSEIYNP